MSSAPPRPWYRPGWRFWLALFGLAWATLTAGACWGTAHIADALSQVTRYRAAGPGPEDDLDATARPYRFDLVAWEARELARWVLDTLALPSQPPTAQELATVRRYFQLGDAVRQARLRAAAAGGPEAQQQAARELAALQQEREALETPARRVLNRLVAQGLRAAGLGHHPPGAGHETVLPPVAFTLARPPSVLVVSPRHRIFTERRTVLRPDVRDAEAEAIERAIEEQGWSAIVEPTGGYSTYPTIISDTVSLDFALQTAAHEWLHTYLFFRPLGFNYFRSPQLATINETAANLVGREVSRAIRAAHFPDLADRSQPQHAPPQPGAEARFDFRREMRTTRLEAERLLQEGRIAEAEAYMEERRHVFVANGYAIRKLNQAYFAFHGTYADTPASIDPIGPALERLLQATGSVRAFVQAVEGVASADDYRALLARYGIAEEMPAGP